MLYYKTQSTTMLYYKTHSNTVFYCKAQSNTLLYYKAQSNTLLYYRTQSNTMLYYKAQSMTCSAQSILFVACICTILVFVYSSCVAQAVAAYKGCHLTCTQPWPVLFCPTHLLSASLVSRQSSLSQRQIVWPLAAKLMFALSQTIQACVKWWLRPMGRRVQLT